MSCGREQPRLCGDGGVRPMARLPQLRPMRCFPGNVPLHELPSECTCGAWAAFSSPDSAGSSFWEASPAPAFQSPGWVSVLSGSFRFPGSQSDSCPCAAALARLGVSPQAAQWPPSALRGFLSGCLMKAGLRPFSPPCASSCVPHPPLPGGCLSYRGAYTPPPRLCSSLRDGLEVTS